MKTAMFKTLSLNNPIFSCSIYLNGFQGAFIDFPGPQLKGLSLDSFLPCKMKTTPEAQPEQIRLGRNSPFTVHKETEMNKFMTGKFCSIYTHFLSLSIVEKEWHMRNREGERRKYLLEIYFE